MKKAKSKKEKCIACDNLLKKDDGWAGYHFHCYSRRMRNRGF